MEDESVTIDLDKTFKENAMFDEYIPVLHDTTIDITISREHPLDHALKLIQQE